MRLLFMSFVLSLTLLLSCEKKQIEVKSVKEKNVNVHYDKRSLENLTIEQFSNLLDENITPNDIKNLFGNDPNVMSENDEGELTYSVNTEKNFQSGVRISYIKFIFEEGKLIDINFIFTHFFEIDD